MRRQLRFIRGSTRIALAIAVATSAAQPACGWSSAGTFQSRSGTAASNGGRAHSRALILYDDSGDFAWLGQLYATGLGVIASHFGTWTAMPVAAYQRGTMRGYDGVLYVGSTRGQRLPIEFVDDVAAGAKPVVWIGDNIAELAEQVPDFGGRFGFHPVDFDQGSFRSVSYGGMRLARRTPGGGPGIMRYDAVDETMTRVMAWAERDDGTRVPWALRTHEFTYVGENPLAYVTPGDRYLAFCDLLFDVFAPGTPERHRAVARIEDVTPRSDPMALRAIADRLSKRAVPFAVAVVPVFQSPELHTAMRDAPEVAAAIRYMLGHGGTLVLHRYTHQHTGTTGSGYRVRTRRAVRDVGGGPGDTRARRKLAAAEGLPRPGIFEYPHYCGSPESSYAIARMIGTSFQRDTFFAGAREGQPLDTTRSLALFFPFAVRDVYGWRVVPENLDHYVPDGDTAQVPEPVEDIIERARAMHVVRDGVAGFFFHPVYDVAVLERIVDGVRAAGYTFASAEDVAGEGRRAHKARSADGEASQAIRFRRVMPRLARNEGPWASA